jgi:hypothetical protein
MTVVGHITPALVIGHAEDNIGFSGKSDAQSRDASHRGKTYARTDCFQKLTTFHLHSVSPFFAERESSTALPLSSIKTYH